MATLSSQPNTEGGKRKYSPRTKLTKAERAAALANKRQKAKQAKHPLILEACNHEPDKGSVCKHQCQVNFQLNRRLEINTDFWKMGKIHQDNFLAKHAQNNSTKRKTAGPLSRRKNTTRYELKTSSGHIVRVCQKFFMATLGFRNGNNKSIRRAKSSKMPANLVSISGKHGNHQRFDKNLIKNFVMLYKPCISHYRREHAPNRLYLPEQLTMRSIYKDFKMEMKKKGEKVCCYETFRYYVKHNMNISFTKLGHEECEDCASNVLHIKSEHNHISNENCPDCKIYKAHKERYQQARAEYEQDSNKKFNANHLIVSADLQKVIMLPRAEQYKEVIFTRRLVAFNESFVPVGRGCPTPPFAALWHEGIAGRTRHELTSSFYQYHISADQRYAKSHTIWLDNCSGQNKNYGLWSFYVWLVNSSEISADVIELKYFEPGHSFMAADSFHHNVEMQFKKMKNVFDFKDYSICVQKARKKVSVKEMMCSDFYNWADWTSKSKLSSMQDRPYMRDIVHVRFTRGKKTLEYAKTFGGEMKEVDFFMTSKAWKNYKSSPKQQDRGVEKSKKEDILKKIGRLIPNPQKKFWETLSVSAESVDLVTDNDPEPPLRFVEGFCPRL